MDLDLKLASKEINEILWREHKTLATAESCTAGRIASVITAVPGSSNYYKGGIICYADETKIEHLKVDAAVIEENTAVCEEVVKQMVVGAIDMFKSDYAISISGYAGPGGTDNPKSSVIVGTIWIAVGNKDEIVTLKIEEDNGRERNLTSATSKAVHTLCEFLKKTTTSETEE